MASNIRPHNEESAATWSAGGAAYDEISRGIADAIEHGIDRFMPPADARVLDIATGTGWTARRLADMGYDVTGVDCAPDLLAAARQFAASRNLPVTFDHADAEDLPYADESFDAVISTFGVMFTQRPDDAANEIARVCRPGGRLTLAVWAPDGNVFDMFSMITQYMPEPEDAPPPSPFEWGRPDYLRDLLGDAFDLTVEQGTSYYRKPDGEAAWNTFLRGFGPLRTLMSQLDEDEQARLQQEFIDFHDRHKDELGLYVPREYVIVAGTRQ